MLKHVDCVLKIVVRVLLALLLVLIIAATVELGATLFKSLASPPMGRLDMLEILTTLGMFMTVLIAIEMMHVVRLYLEDRHLDVEIVLMVALIAVARKVIVFDYDKLEAPHMFGIGAIVLALACALFLLRRAVRGGGEAAPDGTKDPPEGPRGDS